MKRVSLILPVYNVEKYLSCCLCSIEPLLTIDNELIIVNDGSTDKSEEIISIFCSKYPSVKYIYQENSGLSSARNVGLDHANGDYIWFIDSDDFIDADQAHLVFLYIFDKEPDIVCFGRVEEHGKHSIYSPLYLKYICTNGQNYFRKAIQDNFFRTNAWDKIFKTSFIKNNNLRFVNGLLYEDMYFCLQAFMLAETVVSLPYYLYHYRLTNSDSITKQIRIKDLDVLIFIRYATNYIDQNKFQVDVESKEFQKLIFTWVSSCIMWKYAFLSLKNKEADDIIKIVLNDNVFMYSVNYCAQHNVGLKHLIFARLIKLSVPLYKIVLHLALKLKGY